MVGCARCEQDFADGWPIVSERRANAKGVNICTHDELKWGRKKEVIGGKEITVCGRCREDMSDYPFILGTQIVLTEFERHVAIGVLENALNGWEGDQARYDAASRVVAKLKRP
jgi:hypothetical protein